MSEEKKINKEEELTDEEAENVSGGSLTGNGYKICPKCKKKRIRSSLRMCDDCKKKLEAQSQYPTLL